MPDTLNVRICPSCHTGELPTDADTCPLCSYAVFNGEMPLDPTLGAIEQAVRKELREDYTIERLLGRGGMSVVYVARERELNRQVALKVLPLQLIMGRDAVERFTREAKVAASLDHPHIVPVHRIGTATTFLWYSMRLVRGRSLADVLAAGQPLELDETIRLLEPVASALYHAHQRGVVHRDVKPANVLMDQHGWVAVCDFGVAKAFGAVPLTHDGGAVGTPGYMSPEQCNGKPLDGRSDQYALAVLAYECLTGRLPFTANSLGEIVHKHCTVPAPRVSDARLDLSDDVANAIHRAMAKDPGERFPDIVEFVEALGGEPARSLSRFSPVSVGDEQAESPEQRTWLQRLSPISLALAATLALGLGGGWWLATRTNGAVMAGDIMATPLERQAPAKLSVSASPWGTVYLDGRRVGNTPQLIEVAPGRYVLRVEREGFRPYRQVVELAAGDSLGLTRIELIRRDTL